MPLQRMTEVPEDVLRQEVFIRYARTGVKLVNNRVVVPMGLLCDNTDFKGIQLFRSQLDAGMFNSLDSMREALIAIEAGTGYSAKEKDCARHLIDGLEFTFRLLPDYDLWRKTQDCDTTEAKKKILKLLGGKGALHQNRPLPHRLDKTNSVYEEEVRMWLKESASNGVQRIIKHNPKPTEPPVNEMDVASGSGVAHAPVSLDAKFVRPRSIQGEGSSKRQKFAPQSPEQETLAFILEALERFKLLLGGDTGEDSATREDEIQLCKGLIASLPDGRLPELSMATQGKLEELQQEQTNQEQMVESTVNVKQALCNMLPPKYSHLVSQLQE